jgi:hypothetical protein
MIQKHFSFFMHPRQKRKLFSREILKELRKVRKYPGIPPRRRKRTSGRLCGLCAVRPMRRFGTLLSTHIRENYTNDTGRKPNTFFTGSTYFQVKEIEVFEITD